MPTPFLIYDEHFLQHQTAGHPESPERLRHIKSLLQEKGMWSRLPVYQPQAIALAELQKLHDAAYIKQLETFCQNAGQGQRIDEDTIVSTGSYQAAMLAAGAATDLIDRLLAQNQDIGFALVRPPGHHAMPTHTMGFCLFNNIALAAHHALNQYGLKRILILDWDAHHGNATEHMFYHDPRVLCVSWHQYPNWPGTGALTDVGAGDGYGFNLNIPLPVKQGTEAFLQTFQELVRPAAEQFQPELILVSAGYDAHFGDPLTDLGLTADGFGLLTGEIINLAARWSNHKVGFFLEGGYNTKALAYSVLATLQTLGQEDSRSVHEPLLSPPPQSEPEPFQKLIAQIRKTHPLLSKN